MLKGIPCLMLFYLLGEGLARLTEAPIPGAVIGMVMMFAALRLSRRTTPLWLEQSSQFFIRYLALFFLPAAVGLFFLPESFDNQWPAILGAIVLATLISLGATALLLNRLVQASSDKEQEQ